MHAVLQDEPRTCSSCRKKKPAAGYGTAYRTCSACSNSRKRAHALKPRRCSSCRKEKPVGAYDGALRTCRACSDSRKRDYAWKLAALNDPVLDVEGSRVPAAMSKAVAVPAGTRCTSCYSYHDGIESKTCNRCLMSRKDKTLQRRIAKDAAKMEGRKGKKVCGTKNWCLISDFNESQPVCRLCQEKACTANAARRAAKRKVAQSLQLTKAWTEF